MGDKLRKTDEDRLDKSSVDKTLDGMNGISQYLQQVGTAFTDTDNQTSNHLPG